MNRSREKVNPPMPSKLIEIHRYLKDPQWQKILKYNKGQLCTLPVKDSSGYVSVAFGDPAFINKVLENVEDDAELFMDCTFDSTPSNVETRQLLTLSICRYNHVSLTLS